MTADTTDVEIVVDDAIDDSYKIVEWLTLSMRKVASDPTVFGELIYRYTEKLPEIVDAVLLLVQPEHRGVVGDLLKSSGEMTLKVLRWKMSQ